MPKPSSTPRADWVADELRRAIMARDFKPGEKLATTMLAARLGVSQTPLREAFARLAGEGWVDYVPQRGVRVADISIKDMLEIYELREMLEPLAIRRSTTHGDDEWKSRVQVSFDDMVKLAGPEPAVLEGGSYDEYEAAHSQFHRVLLQECGSQWLIRLTSMLSDQCMRFRRLSLPLRSRLGSVYAEHERLCHAALIGDPDEAADAALVHMRNTKLAIMEWLTPEGTPRANHDAHDEHGHDDEPAPARQRVKSTTSPS